MYESSRWVDDVWTILRIKIESKKEKVNSLNNSVSLGSIIIAITHLLAGGLHHSDRALGTGLENKLAKRGNTNEVRKLGSCLNLVRESNKNGLLTLIASLVVVSKVFLQSGISSLGRETTDSNSAGNKLTSNNLREL